MRNLVLIFTVLLGVSNGHNVYEVLSHPFYVGCMTEQLCMKAQVESVSVMHVTIYLKVVGSRSWRGVHARNIVFSVDSANSQLVLDRLIFPKLIAFFYPRFNGIVDGFKLVHAILAESAQSATATSGGIALLGFHLQPLDFDYDYPTRNVYPLTA